jgi:uncharacterized membrane protein
MVKRLISSKKRNIVEKTYIACLKGLVLMTGLTLQILAVRVYLTSTPHLGFLVWNLFLAWVPALCTWKIISFARRSVNARALLWLALWALFLPNTFYIVTDFIHLSASGEGVSKVFDAVLLFIASATAFGLGLTNIFFVHIWLERYITALKAWLIVVGAIVASSYAIYLGRYLRWNSWDVVTNPLGLLFDVSDTILEPAMRPALAETVLLFSAAIGALYVLLRLGVKEVRRILR